MKVVSLFSGGKDSALAVWYAQMQGWEVEALVTVISESQESWMFHFPAVKWTELQAQAIGIPRTIIRSAGIKEAELEDLKTGLARLIDSAEIDGIISGAIASEYQRSRLDNVCEDLGIRSFAPLWHKNQEKLMREQIDSGFEFIITSCNALGLTKEWLGRRVDHANLDELVRLSQRYGLSVAFEGGEAETFVLAAPMFRGKLHVTESHAKWAGDSGHLELDRVTLE